jgi:hypothetical protein
MLSALDFYLQRPKEIVLLGGKSTAETKAIADRIHQLFIPNKTLSCFDVSDQANGKLPTLLAGKKQMDGKLTAYVCHNFTCSLPVTEWGSLKELLLS